MAVTGWAKAEVARASTRGKSAKASSAGSQGVFLLAEGLDSTLSGREDSIISLPVSGRRQLGADVSSGGAAASGRSAMSPTPASPARGERSRAHPLSAIPRNIRLYL